MKYEIKCKYNPARPDPYYGVIDYLRENYGELEILTMNGYIVVLGMECPPEDTMLLKLKFSNIEIRAAK